MFQPLKVAVRRPARMTWADRPLSELTDHIGEAFHQPLLLELPRLRALIASFQGPCDEHCRMPTSSSRNCAVSRPGSSSG